MSANSLTIHECHIVPNMKQTLYDAGYYLAVEVAEVHVDKLTLLPNMGPTTLARMLLTFQRHGIQMHESWERMIHAGNIWDWRRKKFRPRLVTSIYEARGGRVQQNRWRRLLDPSLVFTDTYTRRTNSPSRLGTGSG